MIHENTLTDSLQVTSKKELALQEKKELVEKERIDKWQARQAKNQSGFSYKTRKEGDARSVEPEFHKQNPTNFPEADIARATLCAATGTASEAYGRLILQQTMSGLVNHKGYESDFTLNAAHEALLAMNPQDEFEGMLMSRAIVFHDQSMLFMTRAASMPDRPIEFVDGDLNRAIKLSRAYNETLEALNKHRRKGEQKVTVTHNYVSVKDGGQAIVGSEFNQQDCK